MTHDFTGKAIFCKTWQQMLHLADLAKAQGMTDEYAIFNEWDFNRGMQYFIVTEVNDFMNVAHITGYEPIDYTTFITPPVDDSVYGC